MKFLMVAGISLLFSTGAFATDFTTALRDLDGNPLPNCPDGSKCGRVLTLGDVSALAMLASDDPHGPQTTGDEKVRRFELALKVRDIKDVHLTAEEISLLKAQIARDFPPLVVGRAWAILDPPK